MHAFGQSGVITLTDRNGRKETLLSVPRWDLRWQRDFTLVEPRIFPGRSWRARPSPSSAPSTIPGPSRSTGDTAPTTRCASTSPTSPSGPLLGGPALLPHHQAGAQVHLGGQFALASDAGVGLGARLVFPLRPEAIRLDGVVEANHFLSPGSALDGWNELNLNARVPIPVSDRFVSRVGGGLNVAFLSTEAGPGRTGETRTEAGLNLLGAVEFSRGRLSRGRVVPFAEARLALGERSQVVFTGGLTLGSPRGN
jgi:hypothetical protein